MYIVSDVMDGGGNIRGHGYVVRRFLGKLLFPLSLDLRKGISKMRIDSTFDLSINISINDCFHYWLTFFKSISFLSHCQFLQS